MTLPTLLPLGVDTQTVEGLVKPQSKPQSKLYTEQKRVLVVDDEKYVALMLQEGLAKLPNCEVIAATSGEQVLQLFNQQSFDLLITDYQMPGMDGLTLASEVHARSPQTSVIILSACAQDIIGAQSEDSGIQQILDKPVKLEDIRLVALETLAKK